MAKFTCNFISYTFRRTVDITVVVPTVTIPESMGLTSNTTVKADENGNFEILGGGEKPRHTKDAKYPVLYLFHGMGNNHAQWTGYTNVELFAEERNMAVVMISAENKSYVNTDADKFFDFIEEELPDFVCGMFPISRRPEDTYIAGLSMGGFGTLVHALSFPEKYRALGSFSAAIQLNPASLSGGKDTGINPDYDPETLADRLIEAKKAFPAVYMACGQKDFLYETNKNFRDKLLAAGVDVTWDELPEYGHEWRFWNIEVEKFLDFIMPLRTDAFAGAKRQI
ncbi:MAG: hypothetical protein IJL98_05815 [Lachnospiraceae bacterium]|nr:hypothetical protein [Lachnospiraceae bacterium]